MSRYYTLAASLPLTVITVLITFVSPANSQEPTWGHYGEWTILHTQLQNSCVALTTLKGGEKIMLTDYYREDERLRGITFSNNSWDSIETGKVYPVVLRPAEILEPYNLTMIGRGKSLFWEVPSSSEESTEVGIRLLGTGGGVDFYYNGNLLLTFPRKDYIRAKIEMLTCSNAYFDAERSKSDPFK